MKDTLSFGVVLHIPEPADPNLSSGLQIAHISRGDAHLNFEFGSAIYLVSFIILSIFMHENAYCIQHMSLRLTYAMKDERCRGRRLWVIFWQVLRARKFLHSWRKICAWRQIYHATEKENTKRQAS